MWRNRWALDMVRYLLVIIWDDDTNTGDNDGALERLSFIWWVFSQSYYCGDGIISNPNNDNMYEQCDDWNAINWDGMQWYLSDGDTILWRFWF